MQGSYEERICELEAWSEEVMRDATQEEEAKLR